MTAKQKAARLKFKKVVAEASKLRKKNPKLTQAQAVKQAWAIEYKKSGKSKKVGAVKIVQKDKSEKVTKTLKQVRNKKGHFKGYKTIGEVGATKKRHHKKNISEQSILNKIHKVKEDVSKLDEAQHKHMMSGNISNAALDELKKILSKIDILERSNSKYKIALKNKQIRKDDIPMAKAMIKRNIDYIKSLKSNFREIKKHIK